MTITYRLVYLELSNKLNMFSTTVCHKTFS